MDVFFTVQSACLDYSTGLLPEGVGQVPAEEADAWVLSWADFLKRAGSREVLPKPMLLRQDLSNTVGHNLSRYLRQIHATFLDKRLLVHVGETWRPREMAIDEFAARIKQGDVHLNLLTVAWMT